MGEKRYWNPLLETLPRDDLVQIEIGRFRKVMASAMEDSPMYREKFREAGVSPDDINELDDVRKLPLTEKNQLRQAQEDEAPYLYGKTLGTDVTELCALRQTSGTTGRPVYVPDTYKSWQWRIEPWTCMLYMMGFRETDRVFIPFGYNVYVAFWSGHYAAEKLGCEVVPGGALDTESRIQKIREVHATALLNTPTYGLHMAEVAKEMGINPATDLTVRKMVCAGEPMPEPTNAIWKRLTKAIDREDMASDPRFCSNDMVRFDNAELINPILEEWVSQRKADEVVKIFQDARVPCGIVNTVDQLLDDPQVKARDMILYADYPGLGKIPLPGIPVKLSLTPGDLHSLAPTIGEHNKEVYCGLLGMSTEEFRQLKVGKII